MNNTELNLLIPAEIVALPDLSLHERVMLASIAERQPAPMPHWLACSASRSAALNRCYEGSGSAACFSGRAGAALVCIGSCFPWNTTQNVRKSRALNATIYVGRVLLPIRLRLRQPRLSRG